MKIEERLQQMKHSYLAARVPEQEQMEREWQDLELLLGPHQRSYHAQMYYPAFAFLGIVLLLGSGLVITAQASQPGDALYPVKSFSQKALNAVTGNTIVSEPEKLDTEILQPVEQSSHISPTPTVTPTPTDVRSDVKGASEKQTERPLLPNGKTLPSQAVNNPSAENKAAAEARKNEAKDNGEENRNENAKEKDNPSEEKANNGKGPVKNPRNNR